MAFSIVNKCYMGKGIYGMLPFYAWGILFSIEDWVNHTYFPKYCLLRNSFSIKEIINSWERKHSNKIVGIHRNFLKYPCNSGQKCSIIAHHISTERFTMSRIGSIEAFLRSCQTLPFIMKDHYQRIKIISTQCTKRIHYRLKPHVVRKISLHLRKRKKIFYGDTI